MDKSLFAKIPPVDEILIHEKIVTLQDFFSHKIIVEKIRLVLDEIRQLILSDNINTATREELCELVISKTISGLENDYSSNLKSVINATGVILHTGLGRAQLSKAALDNLTKIADGCSNLELDMETGKRGERTLHVQKLLCDLTGSESALVVNNNAAAVFIALNTLAFGKEAIISRGQLVEIGGSFRIPDVMQKSGVVMHEIGTTNKTKLADYKNAINENTAAIVIAHTSNYRVMGFTAEPELAEIVELAHAHNLPVIHDLGGGVFVDLQEFGLPYEPLVQDSINAGVDVVTFSGDKVLGGPQSGIIVGNKKFLDAIHKNPIMRAVRCDKLIYAALEPTLKLFFNEKELQKNHRVLNMLTETIDHVKKRAESVAKQLSQKVMIEQAEAQIGSGALPLEKIPSIAIVVQNDHIEKTAQQLRTADVGIVGYIKNDKLYLDMRTVTDEQVPQFIQTFNSILG